MKQNDLVESHHAWSYVAKPVNFERLAAAVQEIGMYRVVLHPPPKVEE